MFNETNYTRDSASVLEERRLLEQMISLGVGYPYGDRLAVSSAAITHADMFHALISRMLRSQKCSDADNIIRKAQGHIRNGDDGYYLLDLHKGQILAGGRHPIEDIIIDFTFLGADDRVLIRKRKGAYLHDIRFLVVPNAVFFMGMNRTCVLLKEFHMLSFIRLDDDSQKGFVVDHDAAQNDRPLVLFPCEENSGIIQEQLDHDDRCLIEDYESLIRSAGFGRKIK